MFRKSTLLAVAFGVATLGTSGTLSSAYALGGLGSGALSKLGAAPGAGSSAGSSGGHTIFGMKIPSVTPSTTVKFPNAGPKILATPNPTNPGVGPKVGGIDKLKLPPLGGIGSKIPTLPPPPPPPPPQKTGDHDHDRDHDHDHPWGGTGPVVVVAPPTTVVDQPTTVVAPRLVTSRYAPISRAAATEPCNCLTKQYLADGSVVFQDICTKEAAIANPAALNAQVQAPTAQ
jgi:hypothetical protein